MRTIIKTLAVALLAACFAMPAAAETRVGAVAGISLTDLHFNQNLVSIKKHIGGQAGVMAELMVPGIGFGIDLQLLYSMTGAGVGLNEKKIWYDRGITNRQNITLHNIEIPFDIKYRYMFLQGFENTLAPLIFAGPALVINCGSNGNPEFINKGVSLNIRVGAGVEIKRKMQITVERNWGISEATRTVMLDEFAGKNQTWQLKFIYFFRR